MRTNNFRFTFSTFFIVLFFVGTILPAQDLRMAAVDEQPTGQGWVLVIHGGAGGGQPGTMSDSLQDVYRQKLSEAMQAGIQILGHGGSALDAVEAVVKFMEDCPLFNAGKGSVYNNEGVAEMDASIMDGSTLKAGAVAGVKTIKNPVTAARRVMTETRHVLLMGEGAEQFAKSQGIEMEDPSYFQTPDRTEQYIQMKRKQEENANTPKGTVGAVALDQRGNLAAATSTGGLMMKMKGRVGDTPIIGAGTYANNATCAVSCTGTGEFFIRNVIAYDVSALLEYRGMALEEAASFLVLEKLKSQGGGGGLIAVDRNGNIAMPFNTAMMFRGYAKQSGENEVMIY